MSLYLIVLRVCAAIYTSYFSEFLILRGYIELHISWHPYPRARILAESGSYKADVLDAADKNNLFELSVLINIKNSCAPVFVTAATVNEALVAPGVILRIVS